MGVELRYLPSAQQDLIDAFDWISDDSPERASSWLLDLDLRMKALAEMPGMGRKPRSRRIAALGYRTLVLGDYLVFYKFDEKRVLVHRVLHGARNLGQIV